MSIPTANSDVLDADIVCLFEKQGRRASPENLDKRILDAAAVAVKCASRSSPSKTQVKSLFSSVPLVAIVLLVLAMLYPVVNSFLELPSVVKDSSRIFPQSPADVPIIKE